MVPPVSFVTSPFTTAWSLTTMQSAVPLLLTAPEDPGPLTTTDGLQATAVPPLAAPTANAAPVNNKRLSTNDRRIGNHLRKRCFATTIQASTSRCGCHTVLDLRR